MPRISVITPVHNGARFLAAAVESVLRQTLDDWEYIIVDDGSTDDTGTIAASFASRDPRIRVVETTIRGVTTARNLGYALLDAASVYVFFLDADDVLEPQALERLAAYLDAQPEVGLVGCQFTRIDAEGEPMRGKWFSSRAAHRTRRVPGILGIPRDLRPSERRTPFIAFLCGTGQGPFAMYRRSVLARAGLYDPALNGGHEDTDMFARMSLAADVHYLPDRLYRYRDHANNKTKNGREIQAAHKVFLEKWRSMEVDDPSQQAEVDAALAYYDRVYVPLRHLQVAAFALAEFIRSRRKRHIRWAWRNLREGIEGLVMQRGR